MVLACRCHRVLVIALVASAFAWCLPGPVAAQQATFRGRVLHISSEMPIANALVQLRRLGFSARSDSSGAFTISGVPAGTHVATVHALGFDSVSSVVVFAAMSQIDADLLMSPIATRLGAVRVEATRSDASAWRLTEFNERQALGHGHFIDKTTFEKNESTPLRAVLAGRVPGLRVSKRLGVEELQSIRYGRPCTPQTIVNGIVQQVNLTLFDTREIIGFEYYSSANTPAKYNATSIGDNGSACGTAIFWTK